MDFLRVCKKQRMYADAAKTRPFIATWYWAPKGAKLLGGPHCFTSETWDMVHWWNDGAGEDDDSKPVYYDGHPPGPFTGQGRCGSLEWFRDGAPSDAPPIEKNSAGLPKCCFGRGAYSSAFSEAWDVFRGVRK